MAIWGMPCFRHTRILVMSHRHLAEATPVVQMGCLQLFQGRASESSQPVTGAVHRRSQDHTAKIWELNSMECRGTLAGRHAMAIFVVTWDWVDWLKVLPIVMTSSASKLSLRIA